MQQPTLLYEKNPAYPDEVAVAAMLPYSVDRVLQEPHEEKVVANVVEDEEPEKLPFDGSSFHFVFIIDRSGSMCQNSLTGVMEKGSENKKDTFLGIAV